MSNSPFINALFEKAKSELKTIILPEGKDERVLDASHIIASKQIAKIILLGDEAKIAAYFKQKQYDLSPITVINPETSELKAKFSEQLYEMRKNKGLTLEKAKESVKTFNYFATMMVYNNMADG